MIELIIIIVLVLVGLLLACYRHYWPEFSHHLAVLYLRITPVCFIRSFRPKSTKRVRCFGLDFDHSVGLAAGFDKQAQCLQALQKIGFAFVEVGGVTPKPQQGNSRPRVFWLRKDRAVINRYGLNSEGVDRVSQRLARFQSSGMKVGVNIAPNTDTPRDQWLADFSLLLDKLYLLVDYFTVNLSCPNTKHRLDQSERDMLEPLLSGLQRKRQALIDRHQVKRPLLIKIGPDLAAPAREALIALIQSHGFDGVVAVNTTVSRPDHLEGTHANQVGGLSGRPLYPACLESVRAIAQQTQGLLPIVAVGGIDSSIKIKELYESGASLFQVYTAFIYRGPHLLKDLL